MKRNVMRAARVKVEVLQIMLVGWVFRGGEVQKDPTDDRTAA